MDFFGLVDAIRDYCTAEGIYFIYGNDAYSNALADSNTYAENDRILIADFTVNPVITGGQVVSMTYQGIMSLGQKFEDTTVSSLEEKPIQKYDRRLKDLSTELAGIIAELSCDNELDVTNLSFRFDLNKFDLNADFVAAILTFEQ